MLIYNAFLATVSAGSGDPTQAIGQATNTLDTILLSILGALLGLVGILWIATKAAGSVSHMLGGLPWLKDKFNFGEDLHRRANSAILKLLIEAPLIIFGALLVGHFVQSVTGFSVPITFPDIGSAISGGR